MKNLISNLVFGRGNKLSGLIAFAVVAMIALGCTCGKSLDLGNLATGNSTSNDSRTSSNNPFGNSSSPTKTSPTSHADASKG